MLARLRPAPAGAALVLALAAAFPFPAAADDVECGDVITEDTALTHDLDCSAYPDGDGLTIGADGVTLDLKGHTITGPGIYVNPPFGNSGVDVPVSRRDVTVTNGTVTGFRYGVRADTTTDVTITKMRIHRTLRGLELANGSGLTVTRNLVTGSDLDAIRVGGSDDSLISQNTLRDNVFGIHIADFAGDVTVSRNDISGSRDFGISASAGALDTIVSQNRVITTARDGIYVPADAVNPALNTLVSQNTVFWNGDDGIDVAGSTTVTKNSAYENGALGIRASAEVEDGSGNKAWGNGDPMQCLNVVCSTG